MEHKSLIATLYLKNGIAVKNPLELENTGELKHLAKLYNDSGVDNLYVFDLSKDDIEHDLNLNAIKELCRIVEIPVYGGGNINRLEDIKKILYAGCKGVILNSAKSETPQLAEEGARRFGKEKILISLETVDILFKHKEAISSYVHKLVALDETIVDALINVTDLPFSVLTKEYDTKHWADILKKNAVTGMGGTYISDPKTDVMRLKMLLAMEGVDTQKFESAISWSDFKLNVEGLIPVIVQDYQTSEVLMMAYMNEEAFDTTIALGKMTYYSRSRQEQWTKGETSGHYQYVKSLTLDCDKDTILAKVSQVGVACHTGNPSCFYTELIKKEYLSKNPLEVFKEVYNVIAHRKINPKEGSYTNYLFDKGIDKILKKVGEEATEIVIAAKNPEPEEIKYEISDFLYHVMVLMVEKGVTWEDIVEELSQR